MLCSYLDRWAGTYLSCQQADRGLAEESVRIAYKAAELPPPQQIIWCGSPAAIAKQLAAASPDDQIGRNVKTQVFDQVQCKIATLAEIFWAEIIDSAAQLESDGEATVGDYYRCRAASAFVSRLGDRVATEDLSRVAVRARHALLRWRGLPSLLPRWNFNTIAVGPHDLTSFAVYEYLHELPDWRDPFQPLRGLWTISRTADWMVPHEHVCWLCERPVQLLVDTRGRLHSPTAPALRYPDGWSVYAWKGVEVPSWMIEHPQRIAPASIGDMFDPILRNCMIEIMTRRNASSRAAQSPGSRKTRPVFFGASLELSGGGRWVLVRIGSGQRYSSFKSS